MLEAFAMFCQRYPDSELHIGGEGTEYPRLVELADRLGCRERVRFHGHVEDTIRFLSQFDGFLMTSRSEGMPMAVLEAMSAGLPIVSLRLPGVETIAPAGLAGWYASDADADSFCAIMLEAHESRELRRRGLEAYALAARHYSIEITAERHLRLFEWLTGKQV
jgi:glycosyltransferase involved in cell wall biosynthesis